MENVIGKKERYSYMFAALGQGAIYAMMSGWLVRFYTDVVGLAGTFVAVLMWVARIWDAVNDPMMGIIVDRTRTKFGKMRPYLMVAPALAMIMTIVIFIKPPFGQTGLMVYCAATYILWGMAYTVGDVPFWSLPSAMTPNSGERANFISVSRIFNSIGGALPLLVVSILMPENMLGLKNGLLVGALIFSIGGGILYMLTFFNCKERIIPPSDKPTIKESLTLIKQNKPLLLAVMVGVLAFGRYMVQGAISYAADYVFVAEGFLKQYIVLISSIIIGVGMFPSMVLMPVLIKKLNYKQIVIGAGLMSFVVGILFFIAGYFSGYKAYVALPFLFLCGLPLGVFNTITYAIIADSVDYLAWKTGKRAEGLSFSAQTFMNKLGAAISAGLIPLLLQFVDYKKPIGDVLQKQSDSTTLVIFLMITIIPAVSVGVSTIPMFFYDYVGAKKEQILSELAERMKLEESAQQE